MTGVKLKLESNSQDGTELSLLTQYDDLIRNSNALTEGEEKEFLTFVRSSQLLVSSISNTREEVQRRDLELETLMKENTGNGTLSN